MQELHPIILLDPELLFTMRLASSPILPPNQLFKHFILKRDAATSLLGGERDWTLSRLGAELELRRSGSSLGPSQ